MITDQNGNAVWQWQPTEPFGDNPCNQDPNGTGNQFVFNLRFPGQYFDVETGLFYNYYRDYDPATGRYIQSDPIGLYGASLSTFAYVGGNPVGYIDPRGLVRKLDPNSQECQDLKKKIQNKKNDINKRIQECKANPGNLPYSPPYPGAPDRLSVQGHEDIIQDLKDGLQDNEALYLEKCGGGGGSGAPATDPAPGPAPSPDPDASPSPPKVTPIPWWAPLLIPIAVGILKQ